MIPKIIHQTYKSESEIPEHWQQARQSILNKHSDYQYVFWTDNDIHRFLRTYYPVFYETTFLKYTHKIQQVDAFRYFVLYHYGGIYMDLDIGIKERLDRYMNNDLVLVKSANTPNIYTNSLMMSSTKNAFMRQCMFALKSHRNDFNWAGKHLHVMYSTGPIFVSNQQTRYNGVLKTISKEEFNDTCTVCNMNKCEGGNVFYQVTGNSWHSWDSSFYNLVLCNWRYVFFGAFFLWLYKLNYKWSLILLIWWILFPTKVHKKGPREKTSGTRFGTVYEGMGSNAFQMVQRPSI